MTLYTESVANQTDDVMSFESTQARPFCLEKSSVIKWTIKCFSSVLSVDWVGIR